jgi:16S rRNA (cytosine1402-N4)-methyltransferase
MNTDAAVGPAADASPAHKPVLLEEALAYLDPHAGGLYCDATIGLAGHAREILSRSAPDGRLVGLDRDPQAVEAARAALAPFGDRAVVVHAAFSGIEAVLRGLELPPLDGIVADLGVSSPQLDRAERGFSFQHAGPLDMRMDPTRGETAAELLARVGEDELARILRDFGEERFAGRVSRAIVQASARGQLGSTADLAAVVAGALPRAQRHKERHKNPATRTFQALRIAVNQELDELDRFLDDAIGCLRPGGRICVIAFHSLEDRMIKRRFRDLASPPRHPLYGARPGPAAPAATGLPRLRLLTKRVVVASDAERDGNPRSRSAKLRAAERVA